MITARSPYSGAGLMVVDCCGEPIGPVIDLSVTNNTAYAVVRLGASDAPQLVFMRLAELRDGAGVLRSTQPAALVRGTVKNLA